MCVGNAAIPTSVPSGCQATAKHHNHQKDDDDEEQKRGGEYLSAVVEPQKEGAKNMGIVDESDMQAVAVQSPPPPRRCTAPLHRKRSIPTVPASKHPQHSQHSARHNFAGWGRQNSAPDSDGGAE